MTIESLLNVLLLFLFIIINYVWKKSNQKYSSIMQLNIWRCPIGNTLNG
jgi:hypothetical protein